MPKVEVNGSRLYYKLSGAATGPVLLFSNSLGTTVEMWEPQLAAFESRYRILRYDMRGHGQSDVTPGPCSIAALGQDVVALLDELRIPKVHFCGLSVGGVIGQWLGVNAAQRLASLVLCNTAAKIGTPDGWNQRIADVVESVGRGIGRKVVCGADIDAEQIANGVVILGAVEAARADTPGVGLDQAVLPRKLGL